jgi:HAD superfamily hydrolase (TIGR01549 family)
MSGDTHDPRCRAVVFDVGGTLIHPNGDVLHAVLERRCGQSDLSPQDTLAVLNVANVVKEGFGRKVDAPELASVLAALLGTDAAATGLALREAFTDESFYSILDPDADATLLRLRAADLDLYALSNSTVSVRPLLEAFGIARYFTSMLYSAELGFEKPDARAYAAAAAISGHLQESICYVGDGLVNDVIAPLTCGAGRAILYDRFRLYGELMLVDRITRLGDVAQQMAA